MLCSLFTDKGRDGHLSELSLTGYVKQRSLLQVLLNLYQVVQISPLSALLIYIRF